VSDINYSDDMQNDPNMMNTNKKLDRLQKKDSRQKKRGKKIHFVIIIYTFTPLYIYTF